jgi:hypothetical protein
MKKLKEELQLASKDKVHLGQLANFIENWNDANQIDLYRGSAS